jgi:nucleoside-diphosphate-sugar epimerase
MSGYLYPYRSEKTAEYEWSYTYDKILVEHIIMNSDGPVGTVVRLPAVYGPGDYRLYEFVQRMLDRRPAILLDEHFAHLKWTHAYVDHVAHAIALAVINPVAAGRIYNVGASKTLSMLEIAQLIKNLTGWYGEIVSVKREHLSQEMIRIPGTIGQHLLADDTLIRKELGFAESIELQECLLRMIEWQRNHAPHDAAKRVNYPQEDELLRQLFKNS